jgi:hypothetical protein
MSEPKESGKPPSKELTKPGDDIFNVIAVIEKAGSKDKT